MKPFITAFLIVSISGATAWQLGRARNHLHAQQMPQVGPVAPEIGSVAGMTTPEATLALLLASRDPQQSHLLLAAREYAAIESLPTEALATWLRARKPLPRDHLWEAIAIEWARRDGPSALAFAMDLRTRHPRTGDCACCGGEPGGQFHELVDEVFSAWLAADPAAALAHGVPPPAPEPGDDSPGKVPVLQTLVYADLGKSLDLLATEPPFEVCEMVSLVHMIDSEHEDYPNARNLVARQLNVPDKQAELGSWLKSQKDQNLALGVFARVWQYAGHKPGWLHPDKLPSSMPMREHLPKEFSDRKMARFMGSLAAGANPLKMLDSDWSGADVFCVQSWAYRDPASAIAWIETQTATPDLDLPLIGLAKGLGYEDPAAALVWATRIQRNGTRLRECIRHFSKWRETDPESAESWLDSAPLSADEILAMRSGIETSFWP